MNNEKKEFALFDIIIVTSHLIIGYTTNLEMNFLIATGISILGLNALIFGKATFGNSFYYHSNKTFGRIMGIFELLIGYSILFIDISQH